MRLSAIRAWLIVLILAACAPTAQLTSAPATLQATQITPLAPRVTRTPENNDQTVDLHVHITDGQDPVEGTVWLYWPDTGGDLAIGPTSDIVLPIPADGSAISVTVTAPGYLVWSQMFTPTKSFNLVVPLMAIEGPQPSESARVTPSPEDSDQTVDLHFHITDGYGPVEGTIRLYWPDTGGDFVISSTSDIVLPIPADGSAISVTVTAPGHLTWSGMLTPTQSLGVVVPLMSIEEL
jgi:hypothetical protein